MHTIKTVEIKIAGEIREIEIRYMYNDGRNTEYWSTTSPVALVKIRRGLKLWAVGLFVYFSESGKMTYRPKTVNNRNNLTLISWNDTAFESERRSHHNGQKFTA